MLSRQPVTLGVGVEGCSQGLELSGFGELGARRGGGRARLGRARQSPSVRALESRGVMADQTPLLTPHPSDAGAVAMGMPG